MCVGCDGGNLFRGCPATVPSIVLEPSRYLKTTAKTKKGGLTKNNMKFEL